MNKTISVRLPKELYNQIAILAEQEDRSLNQQICWVIKRYLANRKSIATAESMAEQQ